MFGSIMKVGIAITVKNEESLLRYNLLYHHYLGVENFYVFSDGSTDGTIQSIEHLPFVSIYPSLLAKDFKFSSEIREFLEKAETHNTARQCLNVCFAIEKGRECALNWLISLDADELICLDFHNIKKGQLIDFFKSIKPNIEAVRFPTLEIVQRRLMYRNVFAEETLFKLQKNRIRRRIYDPNKNKMWSLNGFYGHTYGKSALRLTVDAKPKTVHEFIKYKGATLNTIKAGYLLHYILYSFDGFINQNKNKMDCPNTYLYGKSVAYVPTLLWRNIVNDPKYPLDYIKNYFETNVMFNQNEVCRLRKNKYFGFFPKRANLVEVTSVKKTFNQLLNL
ncbi:glycosyltransferase family 2 protein [Thermodesulfobacteriota bacterium]